jgi:regulatory protein
MKDLNTIQKEAISKMARLCSRSEQCSPDIRKKLVALGLESIVAEEVIDLLEKENYLNDDRYIKAYVSEKFKLNKWGKVKLRHYLKMKGLPEDKINHGLDQIDSEQYRKVLLKTMKDKAKTIKKKNKFEKMGQVIRFTQGRGFEPELIHRYLNLVLD